MTSEERDQGGPAVPEDDALGTLIRRAGKRVAVPEERKVRVKEAVRAHWQREVRSAALPSPSRLPYRVAAAAALMVLVGAGAWLAGLFDGGAPAPWIRFETVTGGVRVGNDEKPGPGAPLTHGTEVATDGTGRVALRASSGHSVRLHGDSALRVAGNAALELVAGTVYVDSGMPARADRDGGLEIRTPLGVVREVGTQFEVALDRDALRLRVREGAITVDGRSGSYELQAGHEMYLEPSGRTERRALAPYAPEWDWLATSLPPLEIEGRTLREFLAWAVREGGWTLELRGLPGGESAEQIRLSGSIRGLGLREALEAVLPTCGLGHRLEAGALIVEPPTE